MFRNKKVLYAFFAILIAATILACGSSTPKPSATMTGRWLDPDTSGTITTIAAQGDGYVVVSIINPDRGVDELTESSWANGKLSWTYCPQDMHCIASELVSVTDNSLTAKWWWVDDTSTGGTTTYSKVP